MEEVYSELRSMSLWTYTFLLGGIWGYATYGTHSGLIFLWIGMVLVGGIFAARKNMMISDLKLRAKANVGDVSITILLPVLLLTIPSWLGLVKSLILFIVMVIYFIWYYNYLWKGSLQGPYAYSAVNFTNEQILHIKSLSYWAYALLFGGFTGYTIFGAIRIANRQTNLLWVMMIFVGLALVIIKNRKMNSIDLFFGAKVIMADIFMPLLLLALNLAIPPRLGLLKFFLLLCVMCMFLVWYFKYLWRNNHL